MAACTLVAALLVLFTIQVFNGRVKTVDAANSKKHLRTLLGGSDQPQPQSTDNIAGNLNKTPEPDLTKRLKSDPTWPKLTQKIGEVVGLAIDDDGQPVIFHRAGRKFDNTTFDCDDVYQKKDGGAIKDPTVLILNQTDGRLLKAWGENMFYLPHGLTIDSEGNYWMTDIALHQVLKFKGIATEPSLTLGKAFEPGCTVDQTRFCMPTDVAVASTGEIFVSDGYCNSHIVKFDKDGKYLGQMGDDDLKVPHGIALAENLDVLCVAYRKNSRVVCLNAGLKHPEKFGGSYLDVNSEEKVHAIGYSREDHWLHVIQAGSTENMPKGFTIKLTGSQRNTPFAFWVPDQEQFVSPHDIAVSHDGNKLYVCQLYPPRVWKFDVYRP